MHDVYGQAPWAGDTHMKHPDHTPLYWPANRGDSEMVEDPLAAGTQARQQDRDGLRVADHARKGRVRGIGE